MAKPVWIENKGRRPRDENEMRYFRLRNGWITKEPEKVGGWRWTLLGSPGDIIASCKEL